MTIEILKIVLQILLQRQRTREIVRGEDLTLHLAEDDLDLIEPTGVRRQPVNPHFKGQLQRRNPGAELFGRMCRAMVENQMHDFQPCTQRALKKLQQEGFEIDKLSARPRPGKSQPRGDQQRAEELDRAHPLIPIRDLDGKAWRGRFGGASGAGGPGSRSSRHDTPPLRPAAQAPAPVGRGPGLGPPGRGTAGLASAARSESARV